MNRLLIGVGVAAVLTIMVAAIAFKSLDRPSEADYRLARGRALLDAEDYLSVLQTLRDVPSGLAARPEAHSYLGAAYLRLHLYQAAIKEFEAAVKAKARGSDPWIGLASTYIELGDAQKSREEASRATDAEKASPDAWIALGRAYWFQRNFPEAEKAGLKAQELAPQDRAATELLLRIYFNGGQKTKFESLFARTAEPSRAIQDLVVQFYVQQGQFGRAYDLKNRYERPAVERSILESQLALKRDTELQDLYPQLIANLVTAGRFAEAIEASRQYQGSVSVQLELGKAYWMSGQKDAAIAAYSRASADRVHKLSAEVALAVITGDIRHWREGFRAERLEQDYFVLARLDGAIPLADPVISGFMFRYAGIYDPVFYNQAAQAAQKALENDRTNFDALLIAGTAYQRLNRLDDAARTFEVALQEYPKSAEAASRLANVRVQQGGNPQEIFELMDRAVKLEPVNAGYLYNLGWLYDQMGNTAQATDLYGRAIRLSPLSFEAMNNLALIHASAGQPGRALALLQEAVRSDPGSEAAYFNLGSFYSRQRDWKQSLDSLGRSLAINPANATAAVEKGRILLELGRTEEAIETLNGALEVDPQSFNAYLLLSSSYERTGHAHEAIAALEEAHRIRADSAEVKAELDRLNSAKDIRP